jgi:transposase-like protein
LYLRYGLSYRDVEELPAQRGITVDHITAHRWVQRFTQEFIEAARPCPHAPGDRWFVDETYLKVAGRWTHLYRAVDQHGQVIDVLLSAARPGRRPRFFTRALRAGHARRAVRVCQRILGEPPPAIPRFAYTCPACCTVTRTPLPVPAWWSGTPT